MRAALRGSTASPLVAPARDADVRLRLAVLQPRAPGDLTELRRGELCDRLAAQDELAGQALGGELLHDGLRAVVRGGAGCWRAALRGSAASLVEHARHVSGLLAAGSQHRVSTGDVAELRRGELCDRLAAQDELVG